MSFYQRSWYSMLKEKDKEETMPTTAEVIETLARKLERARILNDLKECKTIEDYQELTKKYETMCADDKRNED